MTYFKDYEKIGFIRRLRNSIKNKRFFRSIIDFINFDIIVPYIKYYLIKVNYVLNPYYVVNNKTYKYKLTRHKSTDNERVIEIPYVYSFIKNTKIKKLLEIGNTLSNYFDLEHVIIDKYETANNIINIDIVEYVTKNKYDLIISVSTIEHIGYDEPKKEYGKALKALQKLIGLLNKNGKLVITVPLNYNPEINSIIVEKKIKFSEIHFMKRISWFNTWKETTQADALKCAYGGKYSAANAIAFLVYTKT